MDKTTATALLGALRQVGWNVTDSGCWEWKGRRRGRTWDTSYGSFNDSRFGLHGARVHRLMYELCVAPIPAGLLVRHKCDNPPCVNPDHLVPGSAADNSRDMVERRRHWRHDRTSCDKGHDLTPPGAITQTGEAFRCTACFEATNARKRERSRSTRTPRVTPGQAQEIRQRRAAGASLKELAADYGVGIQYICNIAKGRNFRSAA